jgi:hypothetical protein
MHADIGKKHVKLEALYKETQRFEESRQEELLDKWRLVAQQDGDGLASFVRGLAIDPDCALFEIYEALADAPDLNGKFLVAEFRRLLALARTDPHNRDIYSQLDAFAFLSSPSPGTIQREILAVLSGVLGSSVPQLRRFGANLAGDLIRPDESDLWQELHYLLETDSDWRVRYHCFQTLKDLSTDYPQCSAPRPLSLIDRLRLALVGAKKWDCAA